MSPRAACRLESIGFGDVYDYVGSKMDWIGAGLPFEGSDARKPRLGTLADTSVPRCSLHETVGNVADRIGAWDICIVVSEANVVLGLVDADALGHDRDRAVADVMQEGPSTYRPHVTAEELVPKLEEHPRPWVLVTNLDGTLVGVVRPRDLRAALDETRRGTDPEGSPTAS